MTAVGEASLDTWNTTNTMSQGRQKIRSLWGHLKHQPALQELSIPSIWAPQHSTPYSPSQWLLLKWFQWSSGANMGFDRFRYHHWLLFPQRWAFTSQRWRHRFMVTLYVDGNFVCWVFKVSGYHWAIWAPPKDTYTGRVEMDLSQSLLSSMFSGPYTRQRVPFSPKFYFLRCQLLRWPDRICLNGEFLF